MDLRRALALVILLAAPGYGAVHLSVAPGPLAADAVKRTEEAAAALLEAPARAAAGLGFSASSWKKDLAAGQRERLLSELESLWGKRLIVRDDDFVRPSSMAMRPSVSVSRARFDALGARLEGMPLPLDQADQDRFYDAKGVARGSAVFAAAAAAPSAGHFATAPRLKAAAVPPALAPRAAAPISLKHAGVEVLKGAGRMVADVFTWKGLAVAAASVALVTVAPVAIYGLLVVGAAFSGWTIGKALVHGSKAYKAGDAEGFYGASREMGRGVLGLGLTLLGARHGPTSLRPHVPRTSGEWRAMAAAVDDEPVVAMSLLRDRTKKP